MSIIKPRGTQDLFGLNLRAYNYVIKVCNDLAKIYGFNHVVTPLFEHAELFHRNNENSDIVKKELYEFKDRGDRLLALRPEATAPLIRFLGESKLLKTQPLPVKLYTYGSMFRYERPQSGRQREFQQFDVEVVGSSSKYDVVDVINFGHDILTKLSLLNAVKLKINFIGSFQTRTKWIQVLQDYFAPYAHQLSGLSQERLQNNPLRILDDKVDGKLDFVQAAPTIDALLSDDEKTEFASVLELLDILNIKYEVDSRLVRGLDYYTNIVFEFVHTQSDNTIIAGGQYDDLVAELAGDQLSAIGLAVGVNRCAQLLNQQVLDQLTNQMQNYMVLITMNDVDPNQGLLVTKRMQQQGIMVSYEPKVKDIKKAIKLCERLNYRYLAILGKNEIDNHEIAIKDVIDQKQISIKQADVISWWNNK